MKPPEVNFDDVKITTDGLFSDDLRVVRLRDGLPGEAGGNSTTTNTQVSSEGNDTTQTTTQSNTANSTAPQTQVTPGNPITPTPPVNSYTPTPAPNTGAPEQIVSPENLNTLSTENQAYQESVQALQSEVRNIRDIISDPSQVSDLQLKAGIDSLVENDPARAIRGFLNLMALITIDKY